MLNSLNIHFSTFRCRKQHVSNIKKVSSIVNSSLYLAKFQLNTSTLLRVLFSPPQYNVPCLISKSQDLASDMKFLKYVELLGGKIHTEDL